MQDIPTKIDGVSNLPAAEWNQVPDELENVIQSAGLTLSGADLFQVAKAVAVYAANGNFYIDSGVVNSYVLTGVGSQQRPTSYLNGQKVRFIAGNSNTGASTVNVSTLGVKNIVNQDGSPLVLDDIQAGSIVELTFDTSSDNFTYTTEKQATELQRGQIQIATDAEANAGSDDTKAITPLKLDSVLDTRLQTEIFPVGFVYLSTVSTNPGILFGYGTWSAIGGRMLVGVGATTDTRGENRSFVNGETSGEFRHVTTETEMPLHGHPTRVAPANQSSATSNTSGGMLLNSSADASYAAHTGAAGAAAGQQVGGTGGNQPHNNMPPYFAVYMFQRTA